MSDELDVLVIGGGQAGLAMGYELNRARMRFLILDAGSRTGDPWRARWDSLTLFTPAQFSGLPGTPFPAARGHYPTRDEVAAYLEAYVAEHRLPVRSGQRVERLARAAGGFEARTASATHRARQVVIATGPFQTPVRPPFAADLPASVRQIHSADYRRPTDLPNGPVVVVGGGNSGLQIAAELAATRPTTLCIGSAGAALPQRFLGRSIFWWLNVTGGMSVPVTTPLGRRASRRQIIIGDGPARVAAKHGVRIADRAVSADADAVITGSGLRIPAAAVIWATGFRPDLSWVDAPIFDEDGRAVHRRGITAVPGLYLLGLSWLHTRGSGLLGWVGRDARWLARRMGAGGTEARPPHPTRPGGERP